MNQGLVVFKVQLFSKRTHDSHDLLLHSGLTFGECPRRPSVHFEGEPPGAIPRGSAMGTQEAVRRQRGLLVGWKRRHEAETGRPCWR